MSDLAQVILIDDEQSIRTSIEQWLELAGYKVETFADAGQALAGISPAFGGVVVTDVKMPRMDGMELQRRVAGIDPELPVVLVTGHGDVSMAVEAMRNGAYDFIEKPFEPDRLLDVVRRACDKRRLVLENRDLCQKLAGPVDIDHRLIGNSPAIRRLRQGILEISDTDASVLILGETGTGKEVAARCLHDFGSRSRGRFVALNCAAIPESIFESELFGHEAGAFTGAQKRRIGKIEHASSGTLFLDEIANMPLHLQVKLLRALQEREIERVGSNEPVAVDIRVVSACNVDLKAAVEAGGFRSDLYYRLNVVEITVPTLAERNGDIPLLFEYFLSSASDAYKREAPAVTTDGLAALMLHAWHGNVRELKNIAERYVLSSLPPASRLQAILDQPQTHDEDGTSTSLADQAQRFECRIIEQALRQHNGNISAVMDELDLPRRTLNQKMLKLGLERKDFRKLR